MLIVCGGATIICILAVVVLIMVPAKGEQEINLLAGRPLHTKMISLINIYGDDARSTSCA
jgi:hypothetical protein